MENASKALLIAGAILLSILLVSVGIAVFSTAKSKIDFAANTMNEQEIQVFNSKFLSYQGDDISGTRVKNLLSILAANYGKNKDEIIKLPAVSYYVQNGKNSWNLSWTTGSQKEMANSKRILELYNYRISHARNNVVKKSTYIVEMQFDTKGLIVDIKIKEKN